MKKLLLLASVAVALSASAQDLPDFYLIGDCQGWTLADDNYKFENKGSGIYEWTGESLGTGFKINDGTWSNDAYNIGGNGTELALDEEYYCGTGGSSSNIAFDGFTAVVNCTVKLDMTDPTTPVITVSGTPEGAVDWFFTGDFNNWTLDDASKMTMTENGVYEILGVELPEAGTFKCVTNGWGKQFGSDDADPVEITPDTLSIALSEVGGEGGACNFTLTPGNYDITWDLNNETVTFKLSTGVASVALDNVEAVYYNLQGVKVNNPKNGIYVKVVGNKANKVVVAE